MTKDQPIYTKDELSIPLPRPLKLHKLTNDHEYIHGYCIALSDTITILQEKLKKYCKQESDIERKIERLMK
jgi:hypothetical protein